MSEKRVPFRRLGACVLALVLGMACTACSAVKEAAQQGLELLDGWHTENGLYATQEEKLYLETADTFLDAVEAGDREAVLNCFSDNTRSADPSLEEQIDRLLELCSGPIDFKTRDDIQLFGSYSNHYGKKTALIADTLIYTCGDAYFWCDMGLTYQNDEDPGAIGVTYATVHTADYDYAYKSGEDYGDIPDFQAPGLQVLTADQLNRPVEAEIRVIDGNGIAYTPTAPLNVTDVAVFLERNSSYSAFRARFDPPCGSWHYDYYELSPEDGEPRYLCVGHFEETDEIYSASVCSDIKFLYSVWKQEGGTV